mmetsp:Transcript_29812/g.98156  ORF Transcript_29812/g.98156 Transcript_29812/m.98156 type:complete len:178 (+) Transcript_29812:1405-1938(+)
MCLVPPARLSQVWRKVFLVRKASAPAHFKLLDEKRELIDEPEDGCPKGVISDADTDHNVFNEWDMYYKSPPNSGQPRNPFEMARARAPTVAAPPPAAAEARLRPEGVPTALRLPRAPFAAVAAAGRGAGQLSRGQWSAGQWPAGRAEVWVRRRPRRRRRGCLQSAPRRVRGAPHSLC